MMLGVVEGGTGVPRSRPDGMWRQHDFLTLWLGQTGSVVGSQVTLLALPLTAALLLRATALQMGLLGAAETAPYVLFSLVAGAWVDGRRRRHILIATDLGRAALLLTIPICALMHALSVGALLAVAFAVGTLTVLSDIAAVSYLPTLIARHDLVAGNGALEGGRAAGEIIGPGVGALVGLLTAPLAVLVDALSFLWSAVLIWRI